jgi:8-oxo-dGTP pyrophosphatase MutT (NUDIX family)
MTEASPTVRHAARVILLDKAGRVLLARFEYYGRRWWAAPGGGLDEGETHEQAARREVREETGHELGLLGPWVWSREHVFRFEGHLHAARALRGGRGGASPRAQGHSGLARQLGQGHQ